MEISNIPKLSTKPLSTQKNNPELTGRKTLPMETDMFCRSSASMTKRHVQPSFKGLFDVFKKNNAQKNTSQKEDEKIYTKEKAKKYLEDNMKDYLSFEKIKKIISENKNIKYSQSNLDILAQLGTIAFSHEEFKTILESCILKDGDLNKKLFEQINKMDKDNYLTKCITGIVPLSLEYNSPDCFNPDVIPAYCKLVRINADWFMTENGLDLIKSCIDANTIFNKKMFDFLMYLKEKQGSQAIWDFTSLSNEMLNPDGTFNDTTIDSSKKLFDKEAINVTALRDVIAHMKDNNGKFFEESLHHMPESLPKNVDSYVVSEFIKIRHNASVKDGKFNKEIFDFFNKIAQNSIGEAHYDHKLSTFRTIPFIIKSCSNDNGFDPNLKRFVEDNCTQNMTNESLIQFRNLLSEHFAQKDTKSIMRSINAFNKIRNDGYDTVNTYNIMTAIKTPNNFYLDEGYEAIKELSEKYKIKRIDVADVIACCKDGESFSPLVYEYAKKQVAMYTNHGKGEFSDDHKTTLLCRLNYGKSDDKTQMDEKKLNVISDIRYYYSDLSTAKSVEIVKNLGSKHLIKNFELFKSLLQKYDKQEHVLKIIKACQDENGEFSQQKDETFERLRKQAYKNRDKLKMADEPLSNEDIDETFFENIGKILKTTELIGEKGVINLFNQKLDGFEDYVEKIADFSDKLYKAPPAKKERVLKLINPAQSEEYKNIEKRIAKLKSSVNQSKPQKLLDLEKKNEPKIAELEKEVKVLKRQLIKDSPEYEKTKKEINDKNKKISALKNELKTEFKNSVNVSPEIYKEITELENKKQARIDFALREQDNKINAINILDVINFDKKKFRKVFRFINSKTPEEREVLKEKLGRLIFSFIDTPYNKDTAKKLNLTSNKFLSNIFATDEDFKENLQSLVEILGKDSDKSVIEALNGLEQNIETKRQFAELGINYDKWVNADKNSYLNVLVETDIEKAKQNAVKNLENDLNDPLFEFIPHQEKNNLYKALESVEIEVKDNKEIIYDGDGFVNCEKTVKKLYHKGHPLEFDMLSKALNAIRDEFNQNEFWSKDSNDEKIDNAKDTIYTHIIKMRIPESDKARGMKNSESVNLEVHKTDMNNISHALFLGNHANCCTAVENTNGWTAPNYIKNKLVSGIEVMDKDDFVGNTMCYFARVDGELSLILDNIELKAQYQYNDKIRDKIIEYAKQLLHETGQPDIAIYAGPNRHKVDLSKYPSKSCDIQIIGSTGNDQIYLDHDAHSHVIDGVEQFETMLYRLA